MDANNVLVVPEGSYPAIEAWYNKNIPAMASIVGFPLNRVFFSNYDTVEKKNIKVIQMHCMALVAKIRFEKALEC